MNKSTFSIINLFDLPTLIKNIYKDRELIRILTWRDFVSKYKGSFFGLFWSIVQPLVMMLLYTLVFSIFFKIRFNSSDSPFHFSVYLLCGLLPWISFSEGFNQSANLIRANMNLVRKVIFPLEILPLSVTLVTIIQQVIGIVILIPLAIIVSNRLHWTILFTPLVMLLQILLSIGVNWLWSSFSIYIPDLRQVTNILTLIIMFLTPIFYPEEIIPHKATIIIKLNPLAHIIKMYRQIFLDGTLPSLPEYLITGLFCLLTFLLGYKWFMRTKNSIPDFL